MILGVATFIVGYVWLDLHSANRPWRQSPRLVFVLRIGYWTRIVCSIIFPVGMLLDLWCGMLSIGICSAILGANFAEVPEQTVLSFLFCYATTLLQGLLLNVVLAGYMLIIAGVIALNRKLRRLNRPGLNG